MIDPTLTYVLMASTGAASFCGGWLLRGKKRRHGLEDWQAPRRDPDATWAEWSPHIASRLRSKS